jgi:predicted aspartyl protease
MQMALGRRAVLTGSLAAIAAAPTGHPVAFDASAGLCVVPVTLNGQIARMLLDTGAERTVLTQAAVKRLGLQSDRWVDTTMRGAAGVLETHADADLGSAKLGGVALSERGLSEGLILAVTTANFGSIDGLLGGDLLHDYELDLDFPRAQVLLRPSQDFSRHKSAVRLKMLRQDPLFAPVRLDGHPLTALLDTGSSQSMVNARGIRQLRLTPPQLSRDPIVAATSIGGAFTAHAHRFGELRIGNLRVSAPVMLAASVIDMAYDLILGLDILGRQRLLLSYPNLTLTFV